MTVLFAVLSGDPFPCPRGRTRTLPAVNGGWQARMGDIVEMNHGPGQPVLALRQGPIHRLTLACPAGNALSVAAMTALLTALDAARDDPECRVVVIAAAGPVFSAGLDLAELTAQRAQEDRGRAYFEMTMRLSAGLMQAILRHPHPVIAEVAGLATDAGCQLVASCDLAIASENATFCMPGVSLGLAPCAPMVALSRNMSRKHAMEMILTGETIDARTAREFGLVNRVVPPEYLTTVVRKYATAIAGKSPAALKGAKEAFYNQAEMGVAGAYDYATEAAVEALMTADAEEGIGAYLQKRPANWTGE